MPGKDVPEVLTDEEAAELAKRIDECAARWQGIGRFNRSRGIAGADDTIRMGRQYAALSAVVKSKKFRHLIDRKVVKRNWRQPTARLIEYIIEDLPKKKIPGWNEN